MGMYFQAIDGVADIFKITASCLEFFFFLGVP